VAAKPLSGIAAMKTVITPPMPVKWTNFISRENME